MPALSAWCVNPGSDSSSTSASSVITITIVFNYSNISKIYIWLRTERRNYSVKLVLIWCDPNTSGSVLAPNICSNNRLWSDRKGKRKPRTFLFQEHLIISVWSDLLLLYICSSAENLFLIGKQWFEDQDIRRSLRSVNLQSRIQKELRHLLNDIMNIYNSTVSKFKHFVLI